MRCKVVYYLVFFTVVIALSQGASKAGTVAFVLTGHVTSIYDPFGLVGSLIKTGDPLSASIRYDTATPDLYPADPTRGTYLGAGSDKVEINGFLFGEFFAQIDLFHNGNGGQELFDVLGLDDPVAWPAQLPTFTHTEITFMFVQTGQLFTFLSSDALPTSLDFSKADLRWGYARSGTQELNMYEIQFALDPVPEPQTWALLAAGLLVCCRQLKRSRRE